MRVTRRILRNTLALGGVIMPLVMCAARTELDKPVVLGDAAPLDDSSADDAMRCSLLYGPVSSCNGPGAPLILRCSPPTKCEHGIIPEFDDAGHELWGCCGGDGSPDNAYYCGYATTKSGCE